MTDQRSVFPRLLFFSALGWLLITAVARYNYALRQPALAPAASMAARVDLPDTLRLSVQRQRADPYSHYVIVESERFASDSILDEVVLDSGWASVSYYEHTGSFAEYEERRPLGEVVSLVMQVLISLGFTVASFYVILSKEKYPDTHVKWAFGTLGTVLGYWLG